MGGEVVFFWHDLEPLHKGGNRIGSDWDEA